jgi:phosphatidylinositol alpha-1,6-mannosyltransferase
MRLLALVTDGFGSCGGIARYNQDLMTALSQNDHVSEIVLLPRFGSATTRPEKVHQFKPSIGRASWCARAFALAMREKFDAVFCGQLNAVPLAATISRLWRVPLWAQVHGIEAWHERGVIYRHALGAATLITSVSRYTRDRLLSWSDVPPYRVRILPNTVTSSYAPRRKRDDLIARHSLVGRRNILTVGRLAASERYKGHDRLIAALPGILARVPDVAYLIVGGGDDRPRLERMARESGVADRVTFAGHVPDEELPDYFALAQVFAMPSTGEGFGIVFLEAAATGLPIVGGNRDGSVDALAEGKIGRLVDPSSREEITAAVVDAFEGRHPVDSTAEVQRFSFPQFAAHVDELVRSLAA